MTRSIVSSTCATPLPRTARKGIYDTTESANESLLFKKVRHRAKAGDVPFEILHPNKTTTGKNLVVLKGGNGLAKTLRAKSRGQQPQPEGQPAAFPRAAWAAGLSPAAVTNKRENLPVAKVTVQHADGENEEFALKNGVEIRRLQRHARTCRDRSLPPACVTTGQVRTFSRALKSKSPIQKITLESFDNAVAPTFVAITAETEARPTAGVTRTLPAPPARRATARPRRRRRGIQVGRGIKTLIVGGGSSHDFQQVVQPGRQRDA